jgi:hypothetical protein
MKRLPGRHALAYALGLGTAVAGFTVGAAWAGHTADSNTITACADKTNGSLYLFDRGTKKRDGCDKGDSTVTWGVVGPQGPQGPKGDQGAQGERGPAGTFSRAVSPNGLYTVTFGRQGFTVKGPAGSLVVDRGGAHVVTVGGATP